MSRLTSYAEDGSVFSRRGWEIALSKLATYEDISDEPENLLKELEKYRQAEQDGRLTILPCKIGDTVWDIRRFHGTKLPQQGIVGDMFFTKDMKLTIRVANVARGEFGKTVFLTREETETVLERRNDDKL